MKKKLQLASLLTASLLFMAVPEANSLDLFPKSVMEKINKLLTQQTVIGASRLNTNVDLLYPKYDLLEITPLIIAGHENTLINEVLIISEKGKILVKKFPNSSFVIIKKHLKPGVYTINIKAEAILPNKTIDIKIQGIKFFVHRINDKLAPVISKIKRTKNCRQKLKLFAMFYEYLTENSEGINDYSYGRDLAIYIIKSLKTGRLKCSSLEKLF